MAQLTWRNVDAPNLSSGSNGVRNTVDLFSNAANMLSQGLAGFGQAQTDQANNAALQNAMQIQDAGAYQNALANGSLFQGIDASKIDPRTLAALQNRTGDLLNNASAQQTLDFKQYGLDRTKQQDANTDAAAPVMEQIQRAYASGNTALAEQLQAQNAGVLGKLTPDQQNALLRNGQSFAANNISNDQSLFNFNTAQMNQSESRNVAAALGRVNDPNNLTADDRQAAMYRELQNLNPNERAAFQRQMGSALSGSAGATGGGAASLMTGGAQLPASVNTVGDFVDNKSSILSGNGGKGTATGLWQITSDTYKQFAQQALGDNWRDANIRDPEVQNKVGEAIWNSVKDNPTGIAGRWASLTPADAQAMKGKSWSDVRDTISQRESGATIAQIQNQLTTDANVARRVGSGQQAETAALSANSVNPARWLSAVNDRNDQSQVSAAIANDPAFKGVGQDEVARNIDMIRSMPGGKDLTQAQAGEIYQRSRHSGGGLWDRTGRSIQNAVGLGNPTDGAGMIFDKDVAEQLVKQASNGQVNSGIQNEVDRNQSAQMLATAVQSQQQAGAVLQQAIRQQQNGANIAPAQMARYQAQLDKATAQVNALNQQMATAPGSQPAGWSAPPPPAPVETKVQPQPTRAIPLVDQQATPAQGKSFTQQYIENFRGARPS